MSARTDVAYRYFDAQNRADSAGVVELFSDEAVVANAANPPVKGLDGIKQFAEGLYERTSHRKFTLLCLFENDDAVAAEWAVEMTFRMGATVGAYILANAFVVQLKGVNVFEFGPNSDAIRCLTVYHETSTIPKLVAENAKKQ